MIMVIGLTLWGHISSQAFKNYILLFSQMNSHEKVYINLNAFNYPNSNEIYTDTEYKAISKLEEGMHCKI